MSHTSSAMYDMLDALEAVIKAADPTKRETLKEKVDAFARSCSGDFSWAIGAQSPALLNRLMMVIQPLPRPAQLKHPGQGYGIG
jgi:hypothetical protein